MSDLINRQDAIEALWGINSCEERLFVDAVVDMLENLPDAESERKTGKWVKVGGYFTPGGDPVWKCSICGKGVHVYGIEASSYNRDYTDDHQWVACPNCGAIMEDI